VRETLATTLRPWRVRVAIAAGVLLLLGAGYWFWVRDSSFFAAEEIAVTGLHGKQAPAIAAALRHAARGTSTLNVDEARIRAAAKRYPVVKDVRIKADAPHDLSIRVVQYVPVAVLQGAGRRMLVAGDGTLLKGVPTPGKLPTIPVAPPLSGDAVAGAKTKDAVALMDAAPAALRSAVDEVRFGRGGLVAKLAQGPQLRFGAPERLRAKWLAAARVLADKHAAGAKYLYLGVPERPIAGRFPHEAAEAPAIDPATGAPIDPATGLPIDPAAAAAADPTAQTAVDPATGAPIDPATGAPVETPVDPAAAAEEQAPIGG
jgi:cell division septal protein FtsQ